MVPVLQVREYFVKTGVFQILASHRSSSGVSARPSVSATTAAPAVSAGSPQEAPGAPSTSSSPPQDPTQFAIRMHDHTAGRRAAPEEATATDLLRDSTLDSEAQRRLQLAAGAFRDPGARGGSLNSGHGLAAGQHGSSGMAAAACTSASQPQQQPLHALLHAIDVMQERESPARHSEGNLEDSAAGAASVQAGATAAAGGMLSSGQLREAAALLLASSGASGAGAAPVMLPAALVTGSGTAATATPHLPPHLPLDMQQMLAGALRAQLVASSPMPWTYGSAPPPALPVGSASVGLDALALQHWWATAGGLPGASAPAGDAVLREVQNMFGEAPTAPKEER